MINFIVKLFTLSLSLSLAIKYGGPLLPLPATSAVALMIVLLPSGAIAGLLFWRSRVIGPKS